MATKKQKARKEAAKKVVTKNKGLIGGAARGMIRRQTKVKSFLDSL